VEVVSVEEASVEEASAEVVSVEEVSAEVALAEVALAEVALWHHLSNYIKQLYLHSNLLDILASPVFYAESILVLTISVNKSEV
jgi:hypothetical protein